jgi:hypothetical protein
MLKLHLKIGICVPSGNQWDADFGMCLINLFAHVLTRPMKGVRQIHVTLINERTSLIPKSRQGLLTRALKQGCDYALFIDSDQTFPSNVLYRLLSWQRPIVACNVATKSIPASPTARTYNPLHPGGDVVFSDPEKHGVQEVWRIGTGVMLVDLGILKSIPKPWFMLKYDDKLEEFTGEDWYFCELLEKHGHKLWIDHDLSREVGHIGKMVYTHELVGEVVQVPVDQQEMTDKPVDQPVVLTP